MSQKLAIPPFSVNFGPKKGRYDKLGFSQCFLRKNYASTGAASGATVARDEGIAVTHPSELGRGNNTASSDWGCLTAQIGPQSNNKGNEENVEAM